MENQLNTIQICKKSSISNHFDMFRYVRQPFRSTLQIDGQKFYNLIKASHETNDSSRQHEFEGQNGIGMEAILKLESSGT